MAKRYPIRIGRRSAPFLRFFFGVTPARAWAQIADGLVSARFGWWRFGVPISQVANWRIEGPWRWITAIGVRWSLRHGDVSFAGSPQGGIRLDFHAPAHWGIFRPPAFYLGVDDLEAFAAELSALGIPGHDARTDRGPR
jgi:hypothetical protein